MRKKLRFSDLNVLRFLGRCDSVVVFFTDISQRVFGSDTNFSVSVEHSIVVSVCYYYSQYKCVL